MIKVSFFKDLLTGGHWAGDSSLLSHSSASGAAPRQSPFAINQSFLAVNWTVVSRSLSFLVLLFPWENVDVFFKRALKMPPVLPATIVIFFPATLWPHVVFLCLDRQALTWWNLMALGLYFASDGSDYFKSCPVIWSSRWKANIWDSAVLWTHKASLSVNVHTCGLCKLLFKLAYGTSVTLPRSLSHIFKSKTICTSPLLSPISVSFLLGSKCGLVKQDCHPQTPSVKPWDEGVGCLGFHSDWLYMIIVRISK